MSAEPVLVDTDAAAAAVGRPSSTVRRWGHAGLLERQGRDAKGRQQWDLEQVYAADKLTRGGRRAVQ